MSGPGLPLTIRSFEEIDREAVVALWQLCGLTRPWNNPTTDIDLAITGATSTILIGTADGHVVASVMTGFDGHRGWIYYLAVAPDQARVGYGRSMMRAAEDWLKGQGAPKAELMVRDDNRSTIGFYEALGYELQHVTVLGRRLGGRN
jgi:ribosomal protein S18 acetylase RimI-like enzyme